MLLNITCLIALSRNESSLVSALKTLLFFTILMVTVPVGLYFASKAYIFEGRSMASNITVFFFRLLIQFRTAVVGNFTITSRL